MHSNMNFYGKRVLFIGAHPDDIELGAGALLHQILPYSNVLCVTISNNQRNSLLTNVVNELHKSMAVLGVSKDKVIVGSFETREFSTVRQEILDFLIKQHREFRPDTVFVHSRADIHQDHNVVTDEALRAFRGTTVLGFEIVRSSYGFFPHCLIEVSEEDVNKKIEALSQYGTYSTKYYFDPAVLRATMIRNGALAERSFAEGFDVLRIVGRFEPPN
jgi:N-acetylglucosamine malate deacetylase 1